MSNGKKKRALTPEEQQRQTDIALLRDNVDRIQKSPFAATPEGKKIVRLLKDYDARGKIRYAKPDELDDDRGGWTGDEILVNEEFRGNLGKTMPTLVHEAAHATWRAEHPIGPKRRESPDESCENEYHSVQYEVEMYRWLKEDVKLARPEYELDVRLDRHNNGTLKAITIQSCKDKLQQNQENIDKLLKNNDRVP
jgi:hypothetical protein